MFLTQVFLSNVKFELWFKMQTHWQYKGKPEYNGNTLTALESAMTAPQTFTQSQQVTQHFHL